jgi:hypothetical protein
VTRITDTEMTSDLTRHTATAWPVPDEPTLWSVTWLPGRALIRNQAITAMTIAETVATADLDAEFGRSREGSRWWGHLENWASELGISGPYAVAEASLSPEDHAVPRSKWPEAAGLDAAPALTPDDRAIMGRARGLAAARGDSALRAWFRSQDRNRGASTAASDTAFLYGSATGAAQALIGDLLRIIERTAGHPHPAADGVTLPPADMATVRAALKDAAAWRGDPGYCSDCEALPDGELCGDHRGDEELTTSYTELLGRLGDDRSGS